MEIKKENKISLISKEQILIKEINFRLIYELINYIGVCLYF